MILLVDSNELLLETMQDYLASLGHECIATRDAVEAAEILAGEANINLLVCEQILSHHSGIELIQQAAQSRPAMKNILISSRDNVDVLPADIHFLAKPFSFDSLGILVTLFIPPVNQVMIPDANRLDRNARLNLA